MIEHFIFISFLFIFIFSTIGYGFLFSRLIFKDFTVLNYGYQGIIGFFILSLISIITSYFIAHNFIHNSIVHIIGVTMFFFNFINKRNEKLKELALLFLIISALLIGLYIFKNHDDFPYYHLTFREVNPFHFLLFQKCCYSSGSGNIFRGRETQFGQVSATGITMRQNPIGQDLFGE